MRRPTPRRTAGGAIRRDGARLRKRGEHGAGSRQAVDENHKRYIERLGRLDMRKLLKRNKQQQFAKGEGQISNRTFEGRGVLPNIRRLRMPLQRGLAYAVLERGHPHVPTIMTDE